MKTPKKEVSVLDNRCFNCLHCFIDDKDGKYKCKLRTSGNLLSTEKAEVTPQTSCSYHEKTENPLNIMSNDVLSLLDEEEKEIKYLDQGFNNSSWWYGFNLKGREAIILSDGKILRNTLDSFKGKTFGENQIKELFDYEGYIGNIAPIISKETIKRYYTKLARNHLVSPKEIYQSIRDKLLHYMDFAGKNEIADVLSCWILATYCYQLFYWFPHILINAPSGSGKSKCVFIITQLSFRGYDIGASGGATPAQIFRTIEGNRGTMSFDEFEQHDSKNSSISDTQKLVNQILNASATKDAYVIRTEQIDKKWRSWKFPIFCPKIVANISGINPTSLSRFIAFKWLKTDNKIKGSRKPYKERDKAAFKPIREDCHLFILENWKKIKSIFDNLEIKELTNRNEDNWLPLFSIARFIDQSSNNCFNVEQQLLTYIKSYKDVEIETNDFTNELLTIIYEVVKLDNSPNYYQPKDIADWAAIKDLLGHYKSPANFIGRKLKLYQFPTNRTGGVRKYLLTKDNVSKILNTYFGTDITTLNNTNNT